jgi:hypothetical protein
MKSLSALILLTLISINVTAEQIKESVLLRWESPQKFQITEDISETFIYFNGATSHSRWGNLPVYKKSLDLYVESNIEVQLSNEIYIPLTEEELNLIEGTELAPIIESDISTGWQKGKFKAIVRVLPFRENFDGSIEKLASFELNIITTAKKSVNKESTPEYPTESVFNNGTWHKIRLQEDGMYKLTYEQLEEMGLDPKNFNPSTMGIFGNGGDLLKERTDLFRYLGVQENAIYIHGEEDNSFDPGDYILFYGDAPHYWEKTNTNKPWVHIDHYIEDYSYYFFTPNQGTGKRITDQEMATNPNQTVTSFDEYYFHENNLVNLINTGRDWMGEEFSQASKSFTLPTFNFHSIVEGSKIRVISNVCGRSSRYTEFTFLYNNKEITTASISPSTESRYTYAYQNTISKEVDEDGSTYNITINYDPVISSSKGWLNWLRIIGRSNLTYKGGQFNFRDYESAKGNNVSKFVISNADQYMQVWDVTDKANARKIVGTLNNSEFSYIINTNNVREFVAFGNNDFKSVEYVEEISNQNLHGIRNLDMVIVAADDFLLEAQDLANIHREHDNMQVLVIGLKPIYNEFASGSKDITAIRDFFRMLYKDSDNPLKYAIFMGDGSYDMSDRIDNNTDFVPTYQTVESLTSAGSLVTDDYFAILDDGEGELVEGFMDIGIGRFPVKTEEEAAQMVDKVRRYLTPSMENCGEWKNQYIIIADDQDKDEHMEQAEELTSMVDTTCHDININKIYLDSYEQITTPSGDFYPDARKKLVESVDNGSLVVNYVGHGGEFGWSHEQVLTISDIESWSNKDKLPLFITATCEFSRYDNPQLHSAGERVILNPDGGAISMITTTRLAFSLSNFSLNEKVYQKLFVRDDNGEYPRLGDVMIYAKEDSDLNRNVHLLGDPALRLAHPEHKAQITTINGIDITKETDTLKALSEVNIQGVITDHSDQKLNDFNGLAYITVYDKPRTLSTLANDPGSSSEIEFKLQDSFIFKGSAEVINGDFTLDFLVPKDISYNFGSGKISIYAESEDGLTDARGYTEEFLIGGVSDNEWIDEEGPQIQLFMNDETFMPGDTTLEDPLLLAKVFDESGINTLNNSIGHDITLVLDKNISQPIVLNPYYKSAANGYKEGEIQYQFDNLSDGHHEIEVKIWDILNNSATASTHFYVVKDLPMDIYELINSPNPFSENTTFTFKHKHYGKSYKLRVQIFASDGRLVKDL